MSLPRDIAEFYTRTGRMTDPGASAALLSDAPSDIPGIVAYVQNLLLHVHWAPAYRMRLLPERIDEKHTRGLEDMLSLLHRHDAQPLARKRMLYQRMVGVCRHFTTFTVALLRRAGIPARARVGFGTYFAKDMAVDHWVVEYWNGAAWQLLDAQIDAAQRTMLMMPFDPADVPRDQFIIAADAWARCRAGKADPTRFGIFDMKGLWFIAGNVLRDLAALNNDEMLPWDVWGPMMLGDAEITPQAFALFDKIVALTLAPDENFARLRDLYETDTALRVPLQVFNAERQRTEAV
jgi:Transglutaminase-like superfamily